jgi:Uma2 family endonuclease
VTVINRPFVRPAVDYPESDGSLIAESDWHRDELFDLIYRLKVRYADSPDTYVSGHMFVYYEEGEPSSVFAPDVMVVFGVPKTLRRVYKLWEERLAPSVVFEVSSRSTWIEDRGNKRDLCKRLGVAEYYLWDPRYEYLTPPLQGFRLVHGAYRALRPDAMGCVESAPLGLRLCFEANQLELYDLATGERLYRPGEAEATARQALADAEATARAAVEEARQELASEREALAAERSARLAAESELARLHAENARLCEGGRGQRSDR